MKLEKKLGLGQKTVTGSVVAIINKMNQENGK